jgi:Ras and Rab interactor 2/3
MTTILKFSFHLLSDNFFFAHILILTFSLSFLYFQNFIVRGSSQTNTMAVSVRLPPSTGPYIEHYLVQSNDGLLSLESSRFKFDSIPALIAHYAQCCDELPVQLTLPQALREAKNRQQLSSLALLGQEFWRYPMSTPKPKVSPSNSSSSQIKSPTDTSGIGTTLLSSPNQKTFGSNPSQQFLMSDAMLNNQVETPSDTASSLSSFTNSTGHQLLSPESIDNAMLTMSPTTELCRPVKTTSTFKINDTSGSSNKKLFSNEVEKQIQMLNANLLETAKVMNQSNDTNNNSGGFQSSRATRPTPPNTLSLAHLR